MKYLLNMTSRRGLMFTALVVMLVMVLSKVLMGPAPVKVWPAQAVSQQAFEEAKRLGGKRVSLAEKQGPSMEVFAKVTPEIARVGEPRVVTIYIHQLAATSNLSVTLEDAMTVANGAMNWRLQPGQINEVQMTVTPLDDAMSLPLLHINIANGQSQINKSIHLKTAGRSQVAGQDVLRNTHPLGQLGKDANGQAIVLMTTEPTTFQKLKALVMR